MPKQRIPAPITDAELRHWAPQAEPGLREALAEQLEELRKFRVRGHIKISQQPIPLEEWDALENQDEKVADLNQRLRKTGKAFQKLLEQKIALLDAEHEGLTDGEEGASEYSGAAAQLRQLTADIEAAAHDWSRQKDTIAWYVHAKEIFDRIAPVIARYQRPSLYEGGILVTVIEGALIHIYQCHREKLAISKMLERRGYLTHF